MSKPPLSKQTLANKILPLLQQAARAQHKAWTLCDKISDMAENNGIAGVDDDIVDLVARLHNFGEEPTLKQARAAVRGHTKQETEVALARFEEALRAKHA